MIITWDSMDLLSIVLCMASERISEVEYRFGEIIQNAGQIVKENIKRMSRKTKRNWGCASFVENVRGLSAAPGSTP